jgi:CRISPR-associated protein Csb3
MSEGVMSQFKQPLDIYNPAEFYAALGLLTVFSLQHREATIHSHFEILPHHGENNATFVVSSHADLRPEQVINDLANATVTADKSVNVWRNPKENPMLVSPVTLSSSGWSITLDWWLDELRYETNRLKFWSGNSNPVEMLKSFIKYGTGLVNAGGTVFGFDIRSSRDALVMGYSKKDIRERASLYPQTELLCAIGLQHYRPRNLTYYAWQKSIPLSITHGAAIQDIPGLQQSRYEFEVRKIGQGTKEVIPVKDRFMAASR